MASVEIMSFHKELWHCFNVNINLNILNQKTWTSVRKQKKK